MIVKKIKQARIRFFNLAEIKLSDTVSSDMLIIVRTDRRRLKITIYEIFGLKFILSHKTICRRISFSKNFVDIYY